jgi:hypothetical protein
LTTAGVVRDVPHLKADVINSRSFQSEAWRMARNVELFFRRIAGRESREDPRCELQPCTTHADPLSNGYPQAGSKSVKLQ